MLLAFNTNISEKYKQSFDDHTLPIITNGFPYEVIRLGDSVLDSFETNQIIFSKYSHLLISGSALSAASGSEFDEDIIKVIKYFLENEKPILGICYGHQMLARSILGPKVCRKMDTPEFGCKKIVIEDNPLFNGISNPIFLESHNDEVFGLSKDFEIIATNDKCKVQGYQYKNLPVWGVQFHPEKQFKDGCKMIEDHIVNCPENKQFYINEVEGPTILEQNFQIFSNFLKE
ncbi:MAG: gamma-glutamyl-gamma-aminobutyrate hydrolase family protein [Candidatus Marinimicrobia bacterium]|nr:gamma-glutamyl-gamma-aminobutyrate hydrolase family protein [Candidatus Neomarinimicrobiota bacterium]MBL7023754.1 gamma-glutamyl-gamma-aminobutyrate hydrolase family protein [Candidatus Neomarinimicrobiota bacterium]MBL7108951.1 gamma-glutamyl-gamma-aminobutyrate hydrolase family protein [Candidatus Neomarinimicrobiota bacterium]